MFNPSADHPNRDAAVDWVPRSLAAFLLLLFLLCRIAGPAFADGNLLLNGDAAAGTGDWPSNWGGVTPSAADTGKIFLWLRRPGGDSELRVELVGPGRAQWIQAVYLPPGWYKLSGQVRTDASTSRVGTALIGIQTADRGRTFLFLPDSANQPWNSATLYFRVGSPGETITVVCQLEGSRSSASFRHLSLFKLSVPPPAFAKRLDLPGVRLDSEKLAISYQAPVGSLWTMIAVMSFFAAISVAGWLTFT